MRALRAHVAVCGAGDVDVDDPLAVVAFEVGRRLADSGAVIVCGGLGGVMEAACAGAAAAGGTSVGILPGTDRTAANPHVSVALPTGMGELRNGLVVRAADVLIAVGGGFGTLSEVALAAKTGVPVVALSEWAAELGPQLGVAVSPAQGAAEAVALALALLGRSP